MPELPEVETTRRGIEPWLQGAVLTSVDIRQPSLRWPVDVEAIQALQGLPVLELGRRGKYILVRFETGTAIWHLGMSGSLRLVETGCEPRLHDHIDWQLDNGKTLRYHDPRRFGALLWQPVGAEPLSQLQVLGPEPLDPEQDSGLTAEYLFRRSRGKSQAVKTYIMDSAVVVGVGNIYANESLFMAGIRPTLAAGKISKVRYQRLLDCIREVLARAVEQGGTTLRDFVNSDGKPGYFAQQLQVYGRGGESCVTCERPLQEIRLGQRTTVFCSHCQR